MNKEKNPKKPLIYYFLIVFMALILLNAFVFPMIPGFGVQQKQVSYGEFMELLKNGKIDQVEISNENSQIAFTQKAGKDKDGSQQTANTVYITGMMNDPQLVDKLETAGVTNYYAEIPKKNTVLDVLLMWLVPALILFLPGILMSRMMSKRMGGSTMAFGKSSAKVYVSAESGKTFADVAGQDEAKEALSELVDFLNIPEKYTAIGAQMPKGALLMGPPGTGKTLLAKAVAGEAGVPFFSISGSEFVEMFVGMGAARVRDLFKQAQEKAPCIVFIDEIDTIGKKRDTGMDLGGSDEREQTLNQLLAEMDGFDSSKGVIILAATNRPEMLDKALLRPGRFDRRIPVELPDLGGREAILKVHAKAVNCNPSIDFRAVAQATAGASGAELANIVNEAALLAVKTGREIVEQRDLEESVETVIAGAQRKSAVISDEEKRVIAYHEIGHALVASMGKHSAPVHKITIIPRTSGALGYTMQVDEGEKVLMTKEEALDKITTFTGGRAAEELIFHTCTSGASNDIEQATKIARAMVTRLGMTDAFDMMALETVNNQYWGGDASLICSPEMSAKIDHEVLSIIKTSHDRARKLLSDNQDVLHKLASYLLEKEAITGEEFMEILNCTLNERALTDRSLKPAE